MRANLYRRSEIVAWLRSLFAERSNVLAIDALAAAAMRGFNRNAVWRARRDLGVATLKLRGGGWRWVYVRDEEVER